MAGAGAAGAPGAGAAGAPGPGAGPFNAGTSPTISFTFAISASGVLGLYSSPLNLTVGVELIPVAAAMPCTIST
ncbi:hypothetical protein BN970_02364 [Mycolicibacterium conceptionense]|uniref:Uncharacterized protein n=1 Tax=Mycolicibacterium conceptionense TaxID=451644 RepID=A0A0U1DAX9_9MYCO|nr:hypothetical protein BN970_02364 [Mycolicibacterium conceptionense]